MSELTKECLRLEEDGESPPGTGLVCLCKNVYACLCVLCSLYLVVNSHTNSVPVGRGSIDCGENTLLGRVCMCVYAHAVYVYVGVWYVCMSACVPVMYTVFGFWMGCALSG